MKVQILKHIIKAVFCMTISLVQASVIIDEHLVDIKALDTSLLIEIKYATADNFLKKVFYTDSNAYLRPQVAQALIKVQQELKDKGLGLKIWDAYRPMQAQEMMWTALPDPRYISDPKMGGRHTRGTAVDLTLVELNTGKELKMPTEFDNFTEKAHRDQVYCDPIVKANMKLLDEVMNKFGFTGLSTEWWHYDFNGWEEFGVV